MAIIGFLVFGLFVGFLARLLVPGRQKLGLRMTLLLGIIGSIIGGTVASSLGTGDVWELNILGSIVAIISSMVLIIIGDRVGVLRGTRR